jgi:hypothetical protein
MYAALPVLVPAALPLGKLQGYALCASCLALSGCSLHFLSLKIVSRLLLLLLLLLRHVPRPAPVATCNRLLPIT